MRYIYFVIGLTLATTFSTPAMAADYSVAPLLIEHDIAPRDLFEETVKISNTTNRPLRLYPTVNAISLGEEGEVRTFVPASMAGTATSVTSWIAVSRAVQEIAPGETTKVKLNMSISPNAVAGDYYAFVGFAEGDNRDQAEALVEKGLAPGVVIRFSLKEKRNEYLRLEHFVIPRFALTGRNPQVTYDIDNIGSVPLTPRGEIIFYDSSGREQTAIPVNPEEFSIAPQTSKSFSVPIPDLGLIGRRKAVINIEYGLTDRANVYDTLYFNVLPLTLLVGLFVSLLLLSCILTIVIHKRRYTGDHQSGNGEVPVFVRTGVRTDDKDHDINLKK